jgi:REP element-mobilizing transposase RayT
MELKHSFGAACEVFVNPFEYVTTETEQLEVEQKDAQTASQEPKPVSAPMSAPNTELEEKVISEHSERHEIFVLESVSQISSELTYSCLLIPRFSDHYLAGDITNDLATWMKEICISYGWRLDAISIRLGYFQWVMTVPLTVNPAQFMRTIHQQSSQKIFENYPRFKTKNLSSDFWAPGFSVVHGNSLQSAESINSFIIEVRKQQGIS